MRVAAKVKPSAGRTLAVEQADGTFTIDVKAAAENGRATSEAAVALARHFNVPITAVRLVVGATRRLKIFDVDVPEE